MNADRMTQRVQEALNAAYSLALAEHNTQTTPEHLLAAILDQDGGHRRARCSRRPAPIRKRVGATAEAAWPLCRGSRGRTPIRAQVTVSPALTRLLVAADTSAKH